MENQEFNQELLDYLYGEMNSVQKSEFETRLKEDKTLQEEYDQLVSVQKELAYLGDKEVMEPFSTWGKSRSKQRFQLTGKRKLVVFRPITAIAASVIILFLVGFFTDFSISINDQGFYLGFGKANSTEVQDYLSREDVTVLIEQEVKKRDEILLTRLKSVQGGHDTKLAALESTINNLQKDNSKSETSKEEIKEFFELAERNNAKMIKAYLQSTSQQQQVYFKEMFTQFNTFYREQRENDLAAIQSSLFDINQKQTKQKQETDMALVSLYTAVKKGED